MWSQAYSRRTTRFLFADRSRLMISRVVFILGFVLVVLGILGLLVERIGQDDGALLLAGAILLGFSVSRGK